MTTENRESPIDKGDRLMRQLRMQLNHAIHVGNRVLHLVDVGQRVCIKDQEVHKIEQLGVVFTVAQVVGEGADAFISLLGPDGSIHKWFRARELQPGTASVGAPSKRVAQPNVEKSAPAGSIERLIALATT